MNLRESFSLPYNGTELWYSCLDSLKDDHDRISKKILEEEKLICRPSNPALILYHLYDTIIDYELAGAIVNSIIRSQRYIRKLAIIGLSRHGKGNIRRFMKKSGLRFTVVTEYFDDFEKAKEWLAG